MRILRAAAALGCAIVTSVGPALADVNRPLVVAQAAPAPIDTTLGVLGYTIVVHQGTGVTGLTKKQIADIYSGNVANWKDLGGADLQIVPVARAAGSAPQLAFEKAYLGGAKWPGGSIVLESSAEAVAYVASHEGALTFVSVPEARAAANVLPLATTDFRATDATGIIDLGSINATTAAGAYRTDEIGTGSATSVAPSQASLSATQSQSLITREYIEQSASPIAEYTRVATIAPGVATNTSPNGPGLAESKIVIRGLTDGLFNITFDGIPFSDTNDPTHHSTSYFPGLILGGAEVVRGPGNASDLGYATFGGALKLFSLAPSETRSLELFGAGGTWNTRLGGFTFQSGRQPYLGDGTLSVTYQNLASNGYLTQSQTNSKNYSLKFERPIGENNLLDVYSTVNAIYYGQPDAGPGATAAEIATYGQNYALNSNPASSEFLGYNYTIKNTDFEYIRLRSRFNGGWKNDQQVYTYAYDNETLAANSVTSPTSSLGTLTCAPGAVTTATTNCLLANGTQAYVYNPADPALYQKRNKYRVLGDNDAITRQFGDSFLRFGAWWEHSETNRGQYSIDGFTGLPNYVNGNGLSVAYCTVPGQAPQAPLPTVSGTGVVTVVAAPLPCTTASYKGPDQGTMPFGSSAGLPYAAVKFDQQSKILNIEPYVEYKWVLPSGTTIYPGMKYANITRYDIAAVENTSRDPNQTTRLTYTTFLPYLSLNQTINQNWSFYAQYGRGYQIPILTTFYVYNPAANSTAPQTSNTYQFGFVGKQNDWTFAADYYTIQFQNKLVTQTLAGANADNSVYVNIGGARYFGYEAEATLNIGGGFAAYLNGSLATALDLSTGAQISGVPDMTAALGLIYRSPKLDGAMTMKVIGQAFASDLSSDLSAQPATPAGVAAAQAYYSYYVIPQYASLDGALTLKISPKDKLQLNLYNMLNYQGLTGVSAASKTAIGGASDLLIYNPGSSLLLTYKRKI